MATPSPASSNDLFNKLQDIILMKSEKPDSDETCVGYDYNKGIDFEAVLNTFRSYGFQATNFGLAIEELNKMLKWRLSDEEFNEEKDPDEYRDPEVRANTRCTIFMAYSSNMTSSGVRENIRFLAQHKLVSVLVTTAGGIEEDFIKCFAPTYMGDFTLKGKELRLRGLNRIGNMIMPNDNYCLFENWLGPLLHVCADESEATGYVWSPSKLINRMGREINNETSIYYWAWKNDIPVFSPAITDGSIGDMLYFHSYHRPTFVLDIVQDVRRINDIAARAPKSGVVILGGGVSKHHVLNANVLRNGADYALYISTAQEFDGSDSGARPDEAVSWGKIKMDARPVKIYGEATMIFPLLVGLTFAKEVAGLPVAGAAAAPKEEKSEEAAVAPAPES